MPQDSPLWISWHGSNWIPILNPASVMEYFSEKSNPFYDRTCNNEIVRMQRQTLDLLNNMTGVEYILLHVQDPILYVIRKQRRHTPTGSDSAGGLLHHRGDLAENNKTDKGKEVAAKEEPSSLFQRQRVDMLLGDLLRKFPLPIPQAYQHGSGQQQQQNQNGSSAANNNSGGDGGDHGSEVASIKQEPGEHGSNDMGGSLLMQGVKEEAGSDMKPPPEKKMKM
ncbi:hypothetical protein pipiens_012321 [Culex pipiens pipiens]|uniref:Mediator of RNA polymerase II transcription subunit 6 n=1 Tax=Culex pipiens pipiens TaxID=38569 RepID=A0ABD1D370_CULPP